MVLYGPVWSCIPLAPRKIHFSLAPRRIYFPLPTCPEKQVDLVLSHGFHRSPNFRGMYNSSVTMPLSILLKSQLGLQSFLKSSINSQKVGFMCSSESFSFIEVNPLW